MITILGAYEGPAPYNHLLERSSDVALATATRPEIVQFIEALGSAGLPLTKDVYPGEFPLFNSRVPLSAVAIPERAELPYDELSFGRYITGVRHLAEIGVVKVAAAILSESAPLVREQLELAEHYIGRINIDLGSRVGRRTGIVSDCQLHLNVDLHETGWAAVDDTFVVARSEYRAAVDMLWKALRLDDAFPYTGEDGEDFTIHREQIGSRQVRAIGEYVLQTASAA